MRDIATKLSAARTRLILDKPFLGALVLRLPMRAADPQWCPKTATDARAFYYNPAFIEGLSLAQLLQPVAVDRIAGKRHLHPVVLGSYNFV